MAETTFIKGGAIGSRRMPGIAGKPLHTLFRQIHGVVASQLGHRRADFLAMPVLDADGQRVDWYAAGDVEQIVKLTSLPPAEQAGIAAEIQDTVRAYGELARRYASDADLALREIGAVLDLISEFPEFDNVFLADDVPVATFWGFRNDDALERDGDIRLWRRLAAAATPRPLGTPIRDDTPPGPPAGVSPPPGAPPVVRYVTRWIHSGRAVLRLEGSLTFWSVAAGALLLLLSAFGWWWKATAHRPGDDYGATLTRLQDEHDYLQQRLARLKLDLSRQHDVCWLPPQAPSHAEMGARLHAARAQLGDLDVALGWNDKRDLDLYVKTPAGCELAFNQPGCGGKLDIDANAGSPPRKLDPVEHMTWMKPPPGTYALHVRHYQKDTDPSASAPFRVEVTFHGRVILDESRSIGAAGDDVMLPSFSIP